METDDTKDLVARAREALTKAKGMHDKQAKAGRLKSRHVTMRLSERQASTGAIGPMEMGNKFHSY